MRSLLAGLVPGLPDAVIDGIVDRAEGIPLYAVETVRTLLNDGSIERDGDAFRLVGELRANAVPESLQALIAARIDALPTAERTLVQDASVLGTSFADAALQAVARSGDEELGPMLQHLVQREILLRDDDPRSPERGQYRFVQGLLREIAYGTLARDDRRSRHLAAARYYEALGDDELSGVLAQHYVDAYQAHPDGPEGLAVAAQARVALRAAAGRSTALGSPRRALSYLESALLVATEPAEELDLRGLAFDAAADAGLFDKAVTHAERALELATRLGNHGQRREMTARYANLLLEGHQQQAKQLLADALAEPGLTPDSLGWVLLAVIAAKTEMRMSNGERAIELADQALPHVQALGADELTVDLIITRAVALANMGRTTEAVVHLTGALAIAVRRGMEDAANRSAVNLGFVLQTDDPGAAFEVSKEALDRSIASGVVWGIRYILGNAVDAAIEVGEWDWAVASMDEHGAMLTEPAERLWFQSFRNAIGAYRGEDVRADARGALRRVAGVRRFPVPRGRGLQPRDQPAPRRRAERAGGARRCRPGLGPCRRGGNVLRHPLRHLGRRRCPGASLPTARRAVHARTADDDGASRHGCRDRSHRGPGRRGPRLVRGGAAFMAGDGLPLLAGNDRPRHRHHRGHGARGAPARRG